jgi:hypothetical protein
LRDKNHDDIKLAVENYGNNIKNGSTKLSHENISYVMRSFQKHSSHLTVRSMDTHTHCCDTKLRIIISTLLVIVLIVILLFCIQFIVILSITLPSFNPNR